MQVANKCWHDLELQSPSEEDRDLMQQNHSFVSAAGTNPSLVFSASHQLHLQSVANDLRINLHDSCESEMQMQESEFNAQESDSERHNDVEEDDTAWAI